LLLRTAVSASGLERAGSNWLERILQHDGSRWSARPRPNDQTAKRTDARRFGFEKVAGATHDGPLGGCGRASRRWRRDDVDGWWNSERSGRTTRNGLARHRSAEAAIVRARPVARRGRGAISGCRAGSPVAPRPAVTAARAPTRSAFARASLDSWSGRPNPQGQPRELSRPGWPQWPRAPDEERPAKPGRRRTRIDQRRGDHVSALLTRIAGRRRGRGGGNSHRRRGNRKLRFEPTVERGANRIHVARTLEAPERRRQLFDGRVHRHFE